MTTGQIIRRIRKDKKLTLLGISEITGLSKSTLSDIENNKTNPSTSTLRKISDALQVPLSMILGEGLMPVQLQSISRVNRLNSNSESDNMDLPNFRFTSANEAMRFILEQPIIMSYGEFDISKLTDEDKIEFANEILSQLKLLGYKYNMRK